MPPVKVLTGNWPSPRPRGDHRTRELAAAILDQIQGLLPPSFTPLSTRSLLLANVGVPLIVTALKRSRKASPTVSVRVWPPMFRFENAAV